MRVANCLGSDATTGANGSREVPLSLAATSAPSRVLSFLEEEVAEPLPPEVAEPPEALEGLLFWLGEVLELLLFVMVAGFFGVVIFDGNSVEII